MVVAGRCCWGAGADEVVVGRVGAREAGARPAERLRGMFAVVVWGIGGLVLVEGERGMMVDIEVKDGRGQRTVLNGRTQKL